MKWTRNVKVPSRSSKASLFILLLFTWSLFRLFYSFGFFELLNLVFSLRTPISGHFKCSASNNHALIIPLNLEFFCPA